MVLSKEQKQMVFDATINHYNSGNRGSRPGGGCEYLTKAGNPCAIGRLFTRRSLEYATTHSGYIATMMQDAVKDGQPLKIVLDGKTIRMEDRDGDFYCDLQILHDEAYNWDAEGLTVDGRSRARGFARRFGLEMKV